MKRRRRCWCPAGPRRCGEFGTVETWESAKKRAFCGECNVWLCLNGATHCGAAR